MFNLLNVFFAFVMFGILVLLGRLVKQKVNLFQTLYLPESIIAGVMALLLGPGVLGAITVALGATPDSYWAGGMFPETMRTVWSQSPGVFINSESGNYWYYLERLSLCLSRASDSSRILV